MTQDTDPRTARWMYDRLVADSLVGWIEWRKAHPEATIEQDDVFPEACRAVVFPLLDDLEARGKLGLVITEPRVWNLEPWGYPTELRPLREVVRQLIYRSVSEQLEAFINASEPDILATA